MSGVREWSRRQSETDVPLEEHGRVQITSNCTMKANIVSDKNK